MRYFRPHSLTWWGGVIAILTGLALLAMPDNFALTQIGELIVIFGGGASAAPAQLIATGVIGIGLGDKFERAFGGRK